MQSNLGTVNVKVNPYIEMGKQEGLQEGRQKGLQEGRQQEKADIARKMINAGIEIKTIKNITGLTEEEIRSLM